MRVCRIALTSIAIATASYVAPLSTSATVSEPIEIVPSGVNAGARMGDSFMSANGRIAYAADNTTFGFDDHLWKSIDGGRSFTALSSSPAGYWLYVDASDDGNNVYAIYSDTPGNYILTRSSDAGETWTPQFANSTGQLCDVAVSDSGTKIVVAQCDNQVIYSVDSGANWLAMTSTSPGNISRIDIAGDGSKVVGVAGNAAYITTDGGMNWSSSSVGTFSNAASVHVSDDGSRILVATQSGPDSDAWISTNGGGTFVAAGLNSIYSGSSQAVFTGMSGDGLTMLWMFYGSKIWVSRDGGDNWTDYATQVGWLSAALSRDGMRGVITAENQSPRILRRPAPGVGGVLPETGSAASVTEISVIGSNFFNGCFVLVDGVQKPTTFVSDTELTVTFSARTTGLINVMCDDMTSDWYWAYYKNTTTTTRPGATTTSSSSVPGSVESTLPPTGARGNSSSYWALALLVLGLGLAGFRARSRS